LYKLFGKQTQYMYKQIAKLIEIGLLCQEKDPCNRPSISDIIHDITELESTNMKINNTDESTAGQVSSCAPHNFNSSVKLQWFLDYYLDIIVFVSKSTWKQSLCDLILREFLSTCRCTQETNQESRSYIVGENNSEGLYKLIIPIIT
jgi:hypothetical protein